MIVLFVYLVFFSFFFWVLSCISTTLLESYGLFGVNCKSTSERVAIGSGWKILGQVKKYIYL